MQILKKIYHTIQYVMRYLIRFHKFGKVGMGSKIYKPMRLVRAKSTIIGRNCVILNGLRLEGVVKVLNESYNPKIKIGDGVIINQNCHLTCANKVIIGNGVSILPEVLITDIEHIHERNKSCMETGIIVGSVEIGDYAFIGMGARIIGSKHIRIGNNAVIGANAVVTHDIPDNAVAVGVPARIIRTQ